MKNLLAKSFIALSITLLLALLSYTYKVGYLGRFLVLINANFLELPTDVLSSTAWWKDEVRRQLVATTGEQYKVCLFGDSITSPLGNTLGNQTYNFAEPGMSTISLIIQLKDLSVVNVKCQNAIIAIGTNDADYRTMDNQFIRNMKQIIPMVKHMGAKRIILLPAFYSTVAASHDVTMAGTIERVERINELIHQVVRTEKISVSSEGIQLLYHGRALKESLTIDGVHLNENGKKVYKEALLKILSSNGIEIKEE
ncbi:MAG: SGNH/GDSL hydrolase family protein [Chroococcidiopsidaceae cyanobacterium CP_BM_ER_R8_30]|nr:SGNH/GDSL hydrolase family protein [Chroococcidiopsidaceae cyanobacterium CP_BM_ER_R8_30]